MSRFASFAVSALVALVLAGAAFDAEGGFEIARATWTEIGLVLSGSAVLVVAILRSRRRRLDGGVTLLSTGIDRHSRSP